MSVVRTLAPAALAALLLWPAAAGAQDEDRFFFDAPEDEEEKKETKYDGSLTSTSFYHRETSGLGTAPGPNEDVRPENASRIDRLFTDLRLQLDAEHISGGDWDFRGDARGRYVPGTCRELQEDVGNDPCTRIQSGAFGGNELEVREFYARKNGGKNDISIGRQFALELAATKFDGIKLDRKKNLKWTYHGFAGLYPQKISRDVRDDYPVLEDPMTGDESRVTPIVGGAGASYRFDEAYGSFGAVGIVPLARDQTAFGGTGTRESPRVFATANGYWRKSNELDVYHYLVLDALSASGAGLTNLTLGVNYQPTPTLRTFAQINRIDTETLNVHAQTRLEDPQVDGDVVRNNVEVLRIASESARAGVAGDFLANRLGVSVTSTLRRRPSFTLNQGLPNEVQFQEAQALDVTLRVVDRRSFKDFRFGGSLTRSFGIGDATVNRGDFFVAQLDARRELRAGRAEVEAQLTYLQSSDQQRDQACTDLLSCYGTSESQTISASALGFYRFKSNWFAVGSAQIGRQSLTTVEGMMETEQPSILLTTFFARLAYRF